MATKLSFLQAYANVLIILRICQSGNAKNSEGFELKKDFTRKCPICGREVSRSVIDGRLYDVTIINDKWVCKHCREEIWLDCQHEKL